MTPHVLRNQNVHCRIQESPPLKSKQLNKVRILVSYLLIRLTIILLRFYWSLPFGVSG